MVITIRRKTHEEFLAEMEVKHPTIQVIGKYRNGRTRIDVKCTVCGYEYQTLPSCLYIGCGCPKCAGTLRKTHEEFLEELNIINPNVEVLEQYQNISTKLLCRCKVCGQEWKASPHTLLVGKGCPKCAGVMKKTTDSYIKELSDKKFDVTVMEDYIDTHTAILHKCNVCGQTFYRSPHDMLDALHGCPICTGASHGEAEIRDWLIAHGINFSREKTFKECRDRLVLPFDFYLPDYNIAIEYDGAQHYEPKSYFGGEKGFKKTQEHDQIKNNFCSDNNIKLIRIPYWEYNNIDNILSTELTI